MTNSSVFTKKTLAWVGFFAMTSIIWRGPALADPNKIAPDLLPAVQQQSRPLANSLSSTNVNKTSTNKTLRVIIETNGQSDSDVLNTVSSRGGSVKKQFRHINSIVAEVPASRLLDISDNKNVVYIAPDRPVAACFDYSAESVGGDAATTAAYCADGTGVGVAVLDSGLAPHADLPSARIAAWKDFVNGKNYAYDDCGHGTHVAGIIAGSGRMSNGIGYHKTFKGIAPKVNLVVAKVLGEDGSGYASDVISAIDWVISNASTYKIRVLNLSLGHPSTESYKDDPLCQAVEKAVAANIVVICSAGNMGPQYGTIQSPANDPNVITVGATQTQENATRSDDCVFYYSSRGPTRYDYQAKPDIVAPGNNVISLRARGSYLDVNFPENRVDPDTYSPICWGQDSSYFKMSGTSAATPMVSAASALLIQKQPKMTPNLIKAILMYSASWMTGEEPLNPSAEAKPYDPLTIGAGYLNIEGALAITRNLDFYENQGDYWWRNQIAQSNYISGEQVNWNKAILWGNSALFGNSVAFNDNNWYNVNWGASTSWDANTNSSADLVQAFSSTWQQFWADDPVEDPLVQIYGSNAIWGGRPFPL